MKRHRMIAVAVLVAVGAVGVWACGATGEKATATIDAAADAIDPAGDGGVETSVPGVVDTKPRCRPVAVVDAEAPRPSNPLVDDACGFNDLAYIVDCFFSPTPLANSCGVVDGIKGTDRQRCLDCIITPPDAATTGALIIEGPVARMNVGGCISAFIDNARIPGNCGPRWAESELCASAACAGCIADGGTLDDYETCRTEAFATTCGAYVAMRRECGKYLEPDAEASLCVRPASFVDQATNMAQLFCDRDSLERDQ